MVSGETFPLYRCADCGLIHTERPVPDSQMHRYDKVQQRISFADKPRGLIKRLYNIARRIMLRRKYEMICRYTGLKRGNLMNYGATIGYFSKYMEDHDWQVVSIERSREVRQFSLEMFHHRMVDESVMDTLRSASFDAVTLWHILGNRESPGDILDRMHELLKPGGKLFVALHNPASLDAAHYGRNWAAWDVPRHMWHLTPTLLGKAAAEHGFIMQERMVAPFDTYYICYLSERAAGHMFPITRGFFRGLRYRLKSIRHKDNASSLIYVFRKADYGQGKEKQEKQD